MISRLVPRRWESKSALIAHLNGCSHPTLVIGGAAEAPRAYYSFVTISSRAVTEIGVISSGLGIEAQAIAMDGGRRVLVGHDKSLTWVDLQALHHVTSWQIGGVFFEFLPIGIEDEVVVLHELGALRVDKSGSVKWSVDTDIVEHSSIDAKGILVLKVSDGQTLSISLASGSVSFGKSDEG